MKTLGRLGAFVLLLALAAGGLALWQIGRPHQGFQGEVFYELKRGTSTLTMARELAALGVVRTPWHFVSARLLRPRAALQAGEYRFAGAASARTVLDRIARGDVYYVELTIPEGSNLFEIAELVERQGLAPARDFRRAAADPKLIRDLAPDAPSLEGYLFPSTYQVSRHESAASLCRRMTAEFRRVWREVGGQGDPHAAVTLASLVETETAVPEERPLVAGVYHNRLEAGMKLDCDPTVIYAAQLVNAWRGTIYRSDLDRIHPYNTYRSAGLPPGPIANPGKASLEAALRPQPTRAVYFVAKPDGSGGHVFTETLAAHEKAVASYRRGHTNERHTAPPPVARRKPAVRR
ncbi:MAG: endolytic transglycosylase MltG [Acidobacteria bacterium]|nr:endolytic transglycosylase MltG [Acidobacteriota bacterium]